MQHSLSHSSLWLWPLDREAQQYEGTFSCTLSPPELSAPSCGHLPLHKSLTFVAKITSKGVAIIVKSRRRELYTVYERDYDNNQTRLGNTHVEIKLKRESSHDILRLLQKAHGVEQTQIDRRVTRWRWSLSTGNSVTRISISPSPRMPKLTTRSRITYNSMGT